MAAWLNQWAAQFAATTPDCLATATFYPEPGAAEYVTAAIDGGTRVFKAHVQVGGYDPTDPLLDARVGRRRGRRHARRHPLRFRPATRRAHRARADPGGAGAAIPGLRLVVAHMGMPEYGDFLDICESYPEVRLDTTMAFTPFVEEHDAVPAGGSAAAADARRPHPVRQRLPQHPLRLRSRPCGC